MAAAGTSPALNLREKLAELAGLKQRVSPDLVRCDFTNLVTNGGFDTDTTGWTAQSGDTISIDTARLKVEDTNGAGAGIAYQIISTVGGRSYHVGYGSEIGTATQTRVYTGTTASNASSGIAIDSSDNSSGTLDFVAQTNATYLSFVSQTTSAHSFFDNITLYEADPSDDAPWLRLPFGYKVGTRGMIVRDGVILHPSDYTEITDSGQTFIKPIVAPGASTEFSIWAGA